MSRSDSNLGWRVAEGALIAALVAVPWSLGGAPAWTLWELVGFAAVALGAWLAGALRHRRRWAVHPVLALPAAVALVELVQLVPLPPNVLRLVAPGAAELRDFALVPLGLDGWRPVSVDPPSTARALAATLSLGALLFVALQLGRLAPVRRRLLMAVGAVGLTVALCGVGHELAAEDRLFGLYAFSRPVGVITPFGNVNHLAAFLTLTSTVALALAIASDTRDSLVGWAAGALLMGVVVFLSFSRGGIGSFVATWGVVASLLVSRRAGGLRSATPWIVIGATVAFAGLIGAEELAERASSVSSLERLQSTKLDLWPMFARGLSTDWRLGMGRGAYELGFSRYQDQQLDVTFTHPENVALQWLNEVGVPVALLLAVLLAWVARRTWRDARSGVLEPIVLVGIAGLFVHDVFDFALELNAVPVVAAVALGAVAWTPDARHVGLGTRTGGVAGLVIAVAALAAWKGLPPHQAAERTLAEATRSTRPVAEVSRLARELVDRHPADYVLYADMASFSATRGDAQNALAWVNRVLFFRPADARAHVAAGMALLRLGGRAQALGEFRQSFELGDTSALDVALAVAARDGDFQRLLISRRGFVTQAYRALMAKQKSGEAQALLQRALAEPPNDEVRLEAQVLQATTAAQAGDASEALALLDALPAGERGREEFLLLRCRLLAKLSRADEAITLLQRAFSSEPTEGVALTLVDLLAAQGRRGEARNMLSRVQPLVANPAVRVELLIREAGLWEADARWGRALEALQTASRLEPARADLHYRMATVFERLGSTRSALDEVRKGRFLDTPEGARAQDAWVRRLEGAFPTGLPEPDTGASP